LNVTLLFVTMRCRGIYVPQAGWPLFLGRVAIALLVLGGVLWWSSGADGFWVTAGLWVKVGRLSMVIVAGALAYFAALGLVGFRFADFNRREHR
jgi:putative peptidoglycan lipid II flippase